MEQKRSLKSPEHVSLTIGRRLMEWRPECLVDNNIVGLSESVGERDFPLEYDLGWLDRWYAIKRYCLVSNTCYPIDSILISCKCSTFVMSRPIAIRSMLFCVPCKLCQLVSLKNKLHTGTVTNVFIFIIYGIPGSALKILFLFLTSWLVLPKITPRIFEFSTVGMRW